ncbi:MAG: EAL domain-containing protein, partial [Treponema sp.]|nr:EAL domain-containing protein [Treponema sp.]
MNIIPITSKIENASENLISMLLSCVHDMNNGVILFDTERRCVYANAKILQLFHLKNDLAQVENFWHSWIEESHLEDYKNIWLQSYQYENKNYLYEIHYHKLFSDENKFIGSYFSIYDRTTESKNFNKEHYRATHDNLTNLFTREYFYEVVRSEIQRSPLAKRYIVRFNIKDFKLINDLFGVEKGNQVLQHMADFVATIGEKDAVYGRLHGDHFAICLRKDYFDEEQIIRGMQRISNVIENNSYNMAIHAGVYEISDPDIEVSIMCDRANMAISSIKSDNNCGVGYYDDSLMKKVLREKEIIGEFSEALKSGQFNLFLQAQVKSDGSVVGAEALVRWIHPTRGPIPPAEFIEILEQQGYIHHLDKYIWTEAAKLLSSWKNTNKQDLHISVNMSARDPYYMDIYQIFTDITKKYKIEERKLKIEITETAILQNLEKQMQLVSKLRSSGFEIEIDDFGSGYSSL